jgi:hypothetical protein
MLTDGGEDISHMRRQRYYSPDLFFPFMSEAEYTLETNEAKRIRRRQL